MNFFSTKHVAVFIILSFLGMDTLAQCQDADPQIYQMVYNKNGECIGYDSVRHAYGILYWDSGRDSLLESALYPGNDIDPAIFGTAISYSMNENKYEYSVSNGTARFNSIYSIVIETDMTHYDVVVPGFGWNTSASLDLMWFYSVPTLAGLGRDHRGIRRDSTVNGFSYFSSKLPGIVNSYFRTAGGYGGWDDEGPTSKIGDVADSLYQATRSVRMETVGPVVDTDTWGATQIVDTLITYVPRSENLDWILISALATDIEAHLQSTRTALIAADEGAAATELAALLALVEAEKDANLTSEAYAIFRYNAEYLLDQLENVSAQSLAAGWQLGGLPLDVPDSNYEQVYSTVPLTQAPFAWGGTSYVFEEDMALERGYWINTDSAGTQIVMGTPVASSVLDLMAGWHLIAGPSCDLDVTAIDDPGSILVPGSIFGYNGGYVAAATLDEGEGYWLQTSAAGQLTLDCAASAGKTALPAVIQDPTVAAAFRRLIVRGNGGSQTLYFGAAFPQPQAVSFALPPPPPAGSFDARFEGDSRLVEAGEGVVQIQSGQYPVTVELGAGSSMILEELADGDVVATRPIAAGEPLPITNPAVTAFRIRPS